MICTNLHNDSAIRFMENRFLFCPFQVVKIDISGTTSFYHPYCTLTEHSDIPHATAKLRVTLSTKLHTETKCLPRKLIVCICNYTFSSRIFFCQLICLSPSVTRVTGRYVTEFFRTNYCRQNILTIALCSWTSVTKSISDTSMIPYTLHLSMLALELSKAVNPNCSALTSLRFCSVLF